MTRLARPPSGALLARSLVAAALVAACSASAAPDRGTAPAEPRSEARAGGDVSAPVRPSGQEAVPAPSPTSPGGPDLPGPPAVATGPAQVLFVGRLDMTDPAGPKASWPGTRIITRFEGSAISVKMKEHFHDWMEGVPSYWEISIDRGPWKAIAMIADQEPHDFELASGLPPGAHEVELYKRSEMQTGVTQFLGFDLHGGKPLPPPERQKRRIEVMGDSFATGFGVENTDSPDTDCPGADWAGIWQNFRKSWGALLGVRFDAEVHGIVYSGKGLVKNTWPSDTDPLRDYYARANPDPEIANDAPQFDLQSWIPDVIVMTQGSCDVSVPSAEFEAAYRTFIIDRLRARSASTHIFMGVVGRGMGGEIASIAQRIIAERAAVGDDKMHAFSVKPYEWYEVTACNGHGTPAWHERIANDLAPLIASKLGW